MRIGFYDHGGKGRAFAHALNEAGHDVVDAYSRQAHRADVLLLDSDHHRDLLDRLAIPAVLYPHGGNVVARWDGVDPHEAVQMILVHGPGHAQVLALQGVQVPVVPVGWSYCPLADPQGQRRAAEAHPHRQVIFGPSHALGNGRIDPRVQEANETIWRDLQGLDHYQVRRRTYEDGLGLAWADLDTAAAVIADGTLLALAVARGVPAIAFAQDVPPDLAHDGPVQPAPTWDRWKDRVRFPLDVADGPLEEVLHVARWSVNAANDVEVWRDAYVGGPFDPALVVALIEGVAG